MFYEDSSADEFVKKIGLILASVIDSVDKEKVSNLSVIIVILLSYKYTNHLVAGSCMLKSFLNIVVLDSTINYYLLKLSLLINNDLFIMFSYLFM